MVCYFFVYDSVSLKFNEVLDRLKNKIRIYLLFKFILGSKVVFDRWVDNAFYFCIKYSCLLIVLFLAYLDTEIL